MGKSGVFEKPAEGDGDMVSNTDKNRDTTALRKRAEQFLSKKPETFNQEYFRDFQSLVHELSVYQAELEIQNEELRTTYLELQESRDRYLDLYNSAPVAYLTLNEKALILEANSTSLELFGANKKDLINNAFNHFVSPESQDTFYLYTREIFRTGTKQSFELKLHKKDGAVFQARVESKGLTDADGRIKGQQVTIIDITESKRLEAEQQRIQKLESVGTLAAGIAHDFNNYLTGIMGNISLSMRNVDKHKGKTLERLEEAERACLKAKDLTQQLLIFSRGGTPIKKLINIGKLTEEAATLALRGSRVKPVLSLPDNLWAVEADEGQINQVISNIIINADQAMPKGGIINIEVTNCFINARESLTLPTGNYVHIAIKDTGIGIPKEHHDRIFDPFFTTKQKGSGLGLTTAFSIMKSHDGYITFESEPATGTIFHVYLPASEKPVPIEEASRGTPTYGTGKILVMDDENIIREMLHKMLNLAGYEVELTSDGAEAIEQYSRARESGHPFDAVIMDLTIPGGMGGKEAIKELVKIDPNVKAIVSSGYATDPVMSDYKKYGFSAVVTKPYSVADIEKTLYSLVKK
jgi:two-component system cell cycle sensor histidine kinase/response regulator CckA